MREPRRGDFEEELRQALTAARLRLEGYESVIEDLSREELEHDLREYREALEREVAPLVRRAILTRSDRLFDLAQRVRGTYERIIEMIEEKLADERGRG